MSLHERMYDAVSDVHADADGLTAIARSRGDRIRRRRRALGTAGTAAVVAAVAVGASVVAPALDRPGDRAATPLDTATASEGPSSDRPRPVPIDGRSTAAALRAAVEDVVAGRSGAFAGQGGSGPTPADETYAELELTPADGSGPGVVGINVQHASILGRGPIVCLGWMRECAVRELPGGDRLRTYADAPTSTPAGDGLRVVAELVSRTRDLRVVASSTNGLDLPANGWDVTRPDPVLSTDRLAEVVRREWWGFEVPARFAEAGAELAPYRDLDAASELSPSSSAPSAEASR